MLKNIYGKDSHSGRNSNIELLRAISMLMVIAYHYSIYGFYAEDIAYTANKYFVDIFGMSGKIGTDIFVLITGYYMVNSRFTVKKLLMLMGQIWFYTLGALLVYTLIEGSGALWADLVFRSVFPLLKSHYWFVSYYVVLMLLSPFLNALIHSLNRKQHAILCVLCFTLCSFLPEVLHIYFANGSLLLFVVLYICAAYCRLHLNADAKGGRRSLILALGLYILCITRIFFVDRKAQRIGDFESLASSVNFMGAYSPFAFCIAILLLIWVCSLSPRRSKAAFILGSASFGVYLLHENCFVSMYLWQDLFHTAEFAASPRLFIHAFAVVFLIYAAGLFTENLRRRFFEPLWSSLCEKLSPELEKGFEKGTERCIDFAHKFLSHR